jgi:hypothetical protein
MRTVVPSQIVKFIDRTFPYVNKDVHDNTHVLTLTPDIRGGLMGVVELVALVPARLIVNADALTQITLSIELIRTAVRESEQLTLRDRSLGQPQLRPFVYPGGHVSPTNSWNPVIAIRHALDRCADEAPAVGSNALAFVTPDDLRRTLETDIESVRTALKNGEWKARRS